MGYIATGLFGLAVGVVWGDKIKYELGKLKTKLGGDD